MKAQHLLMMMAILLMVVACKPGVDADIADAEVRSVESRTDVAAGAKGEGRGSSSAPSPGGAFAREPGFQLPVPVSSTPVEGGNIPQSRQVDADGIRAALMDGMEASGANIRVGVQPGGIVSLSGEVATAAEMQRAHYLARAQPGVVEVDYRNLNVRQR